jgi:hypothetical protein
MSNANPQSVQLIGLCHRDSVSNLFNNGGNVLNLGKVYYYVIVELYLNGRSIEQLQREVHPNSCQFQTTPGYEYEVGVRLIRRNDKERKTQLIQRKAFKASKF